MANKAPKPQDKLGDLGGLPPELHVDPTGDTDADAYVVLAGRSVQHDGMLYRENQQITLNAEDAQRLIQLGAVLSLTDVQAKLADANGAGTVTINGH